MKTTNKIVLLFSLLSLAFLYSCDDIIEDDISNDTLQIVAPQNNQTITSNVVNFQWQELDGADKYRIQVYNTDSSIVLDSLVSQSRFTFAMTPGSYQWRVRAQNSAYNSNYTFNYAFSVVASSDLTNQQVILLNPSEGYYTNNPSIILNWQSIPAATTYNFELVNVTNGESIVNQQPDLATTSLTLNNTLLSTDAEYRWKVKGINSTSQTPFAFRKFYLDRVNPSTPANALPANNSIQLANQTILFSWNIPNDTGTVQSAVTSTIEISNDTNFSSILQTSNTSTSSYQQLFTTAGDYYWRVKTRDAAGNIGAYSPVFKFTIN